MNHIKKVLLSLLLIVPAAGNALHDPRPAMVAFALGLANNSILAKQPELKKKINYILGGIYLISPVINCIGFAAEQTIYRAQYKKETYDFSSMFPELFLSYCGGSLLGTVLTQETKTDKQDQAS